MHPRIEEVLAYLDRTRDDLRRAVERVPREQRQTPPAEGRWSVAQVLEHLGHVERRTAAAISGAIDAARSAGEVPPERETSPVLATIDTVRIRDRSIPRASSPPALPTSGMDAEEAWRVLEKTRQTLRETLLGADGRALGEILRPHPVLGDANLYQWSAFVRAHEARHTAQIEEIAQTV